MTHINGARQHALYSEHKYLQGPGMQGQAGNYIHRAAQLGTDSEISPILL